MRVGVPTAGSLKIVDTALGRKGISLQNPSAVDVFYSDDQRLLDSVSLTNLPTVGHILPAGVNTIIVYPWFVGRLFVRSQGAGAQVEVIVYEVDLPCR
jgi:hypothetical protein